MTMAAGVLFMSCNLSLSIPSWRSLAVALLAVSAAPGVADADLRYRVTAGAGALGQEESYAFDRAGAADLLASAAMFIRPWLVVDLAWDGRFGAHAVPLVTDAPYGMSASAAERRHGVTLGAAWMHRVRGLGPVDLEVSAGLIFRHEALDRMLAPHSFGVFGPRAGVALVRDGAALITGLEFGLPMFDSTPELLAAGRVNERIAWKVGVEWEVAASTRIGLTYRGEQLNRQISSRRADGGMVELSFYFGGGQPSAKREVAVPDPDGDGVLGADDACPTKAGITANRGCPDGDKDGDNVVDRDDRCPEVAGAPTERGCPVPDLDADGQRPPDDRCPTAAGPRENAGCPDVDTDADTVVDRLDPCPQQPGPLENKGCPDTDADADRVADRIDRCPSQFGPASNAGCPESDIDSDGLADARDGCPDKPETLNGIEDEDGCPDEGKVLVVVTKERIEIKEQVFFATNKAKIQRVSFKLLATVAKALVLHPEIRIVRVEGHTDSVGGRPKNLKLSQARATSILKHLIDVNGIEVERLEAEGFGPDRPIADNRTTAGRAMNRRVEFVIVKRADP